jgi:cytoskeletal protein RodZ
MTKEDKEEKESVGSQLKKIRLEKGISLEEVHKQTNIHLSILRAIEEDSPINLSPVYSKGFLKLYCKCLGLDPKDFVPDYKEPQQKVVLSNEVQVEEKKKVTDSLFKSATQRLITLRSRHLPLQRLIVFGLALVAVLLLFSLGKALVLRRKLTPAKRPAVPYIAGEKLPLPKVQEPKQEKLPATSPIRLAIRAREDCWLDLKIDGRTVFRSKLKKGRAEAWQAKDKIEFSLGNAGVVDIELNSKLLSSLGRRGESLKNVVITREGLSIKR